METYDFSGWATKANLKCTDGRTIMKDAFKDCDGKRVPLVWNHQHDDPMNVLGHADLKNLEDGVYAYCAFNSSEAGQNAKLLVEHGDVTSLSIWANQLKQNGRNVLHGEIREVSLVLAGANPAAFIDSIIKHSDDDEEVILCTGERISLAHSDDNSEEAEEDSPETNDEKDETIEHSDEDETLEHSDEEKKEETTSEEKKDESESEDDETIEDVLNSMTDKQRNVTYYMVNEALKHNDENDDENDDSEGGNENMKHNVFEQDKENKDNVLSHDAMETIISDAKRYGSMKESFLAHAADYGINQIDYLFPEAKSLNNPPEFIKRDMGWVQKVMGAVHHTPFSRIKSMFADITEDDARAKGYIKGKLKKEEVFSLLKRTTTPTTIYKKQKLDRDDVIDITDFDVVAWLKTEMRMMLDEEIARAILVGDGRLASSDDKISELNIRPVWTDDDLYTIKSLINFNDSYDTEEKRASAKAKEFIRAAIKARKNYKGSGQPTLYTTEDVLTDCLLIEDMTGRVIYDSVDKLAAALRVKDIVTVPVMEGLSREVETKTRYLMGIIVNLKDYNVGADKGGAINMFDDFDIDYNQQKYLIETRCSGALIKPYSAIAIELISAAA